MSEKYISYYEKDTRNLNAIDEYFKNKALELKAVQYHIPAMIGKEVLDKCGYFSSFPHHITRASFLKPEHYGQIIEGAEIGDECTCNSNMYFTPAACLHFYPMVEGQTIDERIITTRSRVYRYEENRFDGKCRLWDFTVREIVFLGSTEFVAAKLDIFKTYATEFAERIGLSIQFEGASDHFYPGAKNKVKGKLQLVNSLKDELKTLIDGEYVAIASFNTHGYHFSKPFNFDNGGKIVSGCIGFGLERWVAALSENNISL
jgi:seryl-tRNA synthetase